MFRRLPPAEPVYLGTLVDDDAQAPTDDSTGRHSVPLPPGTPIGNAATESDSSRETAAGLTPNQSAATQSAPTQSAPPSRFEATLVESSPENTVEVPADTFSPIDGPTSLAEQDPSSKPFPVVKKQGIFRRFGGWIAWAIHGLFCIASLIAVLAVVTAIPIIQLIAFGYLLQIAGNLAAGEKFRNALPGLRQAGQIGLAGMFVFIAGIPTQLLAHQESVAAIVNPGSPQASVLRVLAISASLFALTYLLWAWVRGGRLVHYLWPQPKRIWREGFRWQTWSDAPDRLWEFTASLEIPKLFWLGLRGAAGTLVWLIPAIFLIIAYRTGETGLAGLIGFLSLIALGIALLYLPMLQANFAAENRFGALFEVRKIRGYFRSAPWAWLVAMIISLVILPLPLYLLKIEATPREVMWLPCLVFVAFILPARIATGLAMRRARSRPESSGRWGFFSRWFVRIAMLGVVGIYLVFLQVSQYTSWDGYLTWVQQHAILIPVPFLDGT